MKFKYEALHEIITPQRVFQKDEEIPQEFVTSRMLDLGLVSKKEIPDESKGNPKGEELQEPKKGKKSKKKSKKKEELLTDDSSNVNVQVEETTEIVETPDVEDKGPETISPNFISSEE